VNHRTALLSFAVGIAALGCGSNDAPLGGTGTGGASSGAGGTDRGASGSGGTSATGSGGASGTAGAPGGGGATGGSSGAGGNSVTDGSSSGTGTGGGATLSDATVADVTAADISASSPDVSAPGAALDGSTRDAAAGDGAPAVAPPFSASYFMGADITWVQHDEFYGATYVDTDGVPKDILALLKNHGFNSIRLRTFVDPKAADGYDKVDGFADLAHTVTMGQRIKNAGMGFYLAIHYSDNWADPGKQCIPVAWQQDSFAALTQHVHDYTSNLISMLQAAGARPDLVQVGNEITGGMLIHICDANGIPIPNMPTTVNGSASNWVNLGTLLKAGIQAVKEVDPTIKTVLHIDKGGDLAASVSWINNARAQTVPFDVFADTSYVRWQGQPSTWQNTFRMLTTMFPTLSFLIPEYGNETSTSPATPTTMRIANDIVFGIPTNRGIGTFIYEPEHPAQSGIGIGLFGSTLTDAGIVDAWPVFTALPSAMAVYDQMRTAYASRL
jgi:arabinogalactan endo-1,4-beta-galactosidase